MSLSSIYGKLQTARTTGIISTVLNPLGWVALDFVDYVLLRLTNTRKLIVFSVGVNKLHGLSGIHQFTLGLTDLSRSHQMLMLGLSLLTSSWDL